MLHGWQDGLYGPLLAVAARAGFVELTRVHRKDQPDFIAAIHDARFGRCTKAVQSLMDERSVTDEAYEELQYKVLHIMPRHEDVYSHN